MHMNEAKESNKVCKGRQFNCLPLQNCLLPSKNSLCFSDGLGGAQSDVSFTGDRKSQVLYLPGPATFFCGD